METCFQFKASFSPCTILQVVQYNLEALEQQLALAISRAPQFFLGSPVVIDLDKVKSIADLNFAKLKKILVAQGLVPVGVRSGSEEQLSAAATEGLPVVSIGKSAFSETKEKKTEEKQALATKLVTTPIRSGMQVYAKNGDLIITSAVSAGAELFADGHIHVYGPLRGRAIAGAQGNQEARIFCRTLEAELVSIAGFYLTKEDMQTLPPADGGMLQIYLENEQVKIAPV
jgi:septum site-determining protein MinC